MSGIAGLFDLQGLRPLPEGVLTRMAGALQHRGPDGLHLHEEPGCGLACQELQIGPGTRSPAVREGHARPVVVFDGTLYEPPSLAPAHEGRAVDAPDDAEMVAALWERHGEEMFSRLRGQFAFALWDRRRRRLILARDRFGVSPLHWTIRDGWLWFASEIKALLASKLIPRRLDPRGLCQVFTFFGLPGPVTCFAGISALLPGHYLEVQREPGGAAQTADRTYWQMDFPDQGEEREAKGEQLVAEYEAVLLRSMRRRRGANARVAAFSSGGLDSSLLIAMAQADREDSPPLFTFRIRDRDESAGAAILSQHVGAAPQVLDLTGRDLVEAYPALVGAAECPVVDVSAAALFRLTEVAHGAGGNAVIRGEGADEWQAGYPWFRIHRQVRWAAAAPGLRLDRLGYLLYAKWGFSRRLRAATLRAAEAAVGGHNAWLDAYHLMSTTRLRLFSGSLQQSLQDYSPYDDLHLPLERVRRWHPLNRSIYLGARIHLPGLHLQARGDRSSMHYSLQPRYPFLDEDVFDFLAPLHPRWKLRGATDKPLQRMLADRWLPRDLTAGRKRLLHAPLEAFHAASPTAFAEQLLSADSLSQAGYFDPHAVAHWRARRPAMPHGFRRLFVEMGLVGVFSTQLFHHLYLEGNLCDLPTTA